MTISFKKTIYVVTFQSCIKKQLNYTMIIITSNVQENGYDYKCRNNLGLIVFTPLCDDNCPTSLTGSTGDL